MTPRTAVVEAGLVPGVAGAVTVGDWVPRAMIHPSDGHCPRHDARPV